MRTNFLLFAFFLPFTLSAQFFSFNFFDTDEIPCPWNPDVTVVKPENWLIYQTLDDHWDSPVDSAKCFTVDDLGNGIRFHLDDVDPERPLFFRADFQPEILNPNWLYNVLSIASVPFGEPTLRLDSDCPEGLCSGLLIGIEIPDEAGTGTAMRWHPYSFADIDELLVEACMATEKFPENILKEVILKFTFDDDNISNSFYDFGTMFIDESYYFGSISEVLALPDYFDGDEYQIPIFELGDFWMQNFLFLYSDTTYPSAANISYVEARPEPNSTEQQVINLYVEGWESATFQHFTELRGGLVEGDTIRHVFNFIDNGGDICINGIELIFENDTHFLYGSGNVDFNSPNGCMMFRRGAKLQVLDGATFHYGNGGDGILAMGAKAHIELGENSALHIDNRMMLIEDAADPERELHVKLCHGQSIVFGENAQLYLSPFAIHPVRLNVHMLGGTLDDSNLSAEERLLINRIYPPTANDFADDVHISPNPNNGIFAVEMNLPEAETVTLEVADLQGKLVSRKAENFPKGISQWQLQEAVASGIYFVKISAGGRTAVKKMLAK